MTFIPSSYLCNRGAGHWSLSIQQVLSQDTPVKLPRVIQLSQDEIESHADVISQILPHGQVRYQRDFELLQGFAGADAGVEKNVRAVKGTCTEYNLEKNSFKDIGISQLCGGIQ